MDRFANDAVLSDAEEFAILANRLIITLLMKTMISLPNLLIASAAVCIAPAVILLISPGTLMMIYGLRLNPGGVFVGRTLGAILVGLAILFWQARLTQDAAFRQTAILAGLIHNVLLIVVIVTSTVRGDIIWTGWPAMLVHVALAAGFVYFLRR